MKSAIKSINDIGIQEIRTFLAENHKLGGDHFNHAMLRAWAADAQFSLAEGSDAGIELRSFESVHGRTQTFTVSDAGIDTEFVGLFLWQGALWLLILANERLHRLFPGRNFLFLER